MGGVVLPINGNLEVGYLFQSSEGEIQLPIEMV